MIKQHIRLIFLFAIMFSQGNFLLYANKVIDLSINLKIPNLTEVLMEIKEINVQEHVFSLMVSYYPKHISSMGWKNYDVVFIVNGKEIWYSQAKLLSTEKLINGHKYKKVLYPYRIDSLQTYFDTLPPARENFSQNYIRSSDFQIALVGGMPNEIEPIIKEYRILGIRVRLHPIAAKAAIKASQKIMELAKTEKEIKTFIDGLKTISGYVNRTVKNSTNISMHAFGLAMDFIPYSYKGKMAYWQWAKVQNPEKWNKISLKDRWLIPEKIVTIFELHGFVWGGKWPHYDTMHFEYRPELISYAKIRNLTGSSNTWGDFFNVTNILRNLDTTQRN